MKECDQYGISMILCIQQQKPCKQETKGFVYGKQKPLQHNYGTGMQRIPPIYVHELCSVILSSHSVVSSTVYIRIVQAVSLFYQFSLSILTFTKLKITIKIIKICMYYVYDIHKGNFHKKITMFLKIIFCELILQELLKKHRRQDL